MLMGDQRPLCGLPWPVCPDDLGQRLSARAGTGVVSRLRPALAAG
jgi:hypothetical protein